MIIDRMPLVLEGRLEMFENEGGFSAPSIVVNGEPLDRKMIKHILGRLPHSDRDGCVPDEDLGRVRITIETI